MKMDPIRVRDIYSKNWSAYLRSDVMAPESLFIGSLKSEWHRYRVLDLGIGLGRTTWFFASIAHDYIGSDVVPIMVEKCRELFGENSQRRFAVVDASDLRAFSDGCFDVVVFSAAGIDHLDVHGRQKALNEIARVLKPGGHFLFSSHNLDVFPHRPLNYWIPGKNPLRWFRSLRSLFAEWTFFRQVNREAMSPQVQSRGWSQLRDRAHDRSLVLFYARPAVVKKSAEDAGFALEAVMRMDGTVLTDLSVPQKEWLLHYHCRKLAVT